MNSVSVVVVFALLASSYGQILLDLNQDNMITGTELLTQMAVLDLNGNRVLTRGELLAVTGLPVSAVNLLFRTFDLNDNGVIQLNELAMANGAIGVNMLINPLTALTNPLAALTNPLLVNPLLTGVVPQLPVVNLVLPNDIHV